MSKMRRWIASALTLCMLLSFALVGTAIPVSALTVNSKPANGTTEDQPFEAGTGGSTNFRIPGIVTLNSGRIVATIDARWSWAADAGGIDTLVSVSDDNGANWTYTFANYLGDNGNVANNRSCCFIDPAVATDGTTVYMIADLYPAGFAINSARYYAQAGSTGFDASGHLLLRSDSENGLTFGNNGYETGAKNATYGYYLDGDKIYTTAGTQVAGYSVDAYFNITGNGVNTNLFFEDSPYKPFPTDFLYMTKSTDGLTWSEPELLDVQAAAEQSYLVGPGNGTYDEASGRVIFTAYRHTGGASGTAYECTSLIWMDTNGNWKRSEDCTVNNWSSEASCVVLDDGTVRVFYRDGFSALRYTDMIWSESAQNYVRDAGATEVSTAAVKDTGCQLTAIKYSETMDGKEVIVVATPTTSRRLNGHVYVFTVGEDKAMELLYDYDITPGNENYAYSCLTELKNGDLGLLWESGGSAITYSVLEWDKVTARENNVNLTFVDVALDKGQSAAYTDRTGDYSKDALTGLDTSVATVTMTGHTEVTNSVRTLSSGTAVNTEDCLFTFTKSGSNYVISRELEDGTVVYLNHFATTNNNIPLTTSSNTVAVSAGDNAGMFKLVSQNNDGSSNPARTLHFHMEATTPYWNRCGNDTTIKCQEYLFRPANAGETSSSEIPGYVQLTSVGQIVDGGQYLIAAKNDAGNWYVLNPTTSSDRLEYVAQVAGQSSVSRTEITITGTGHGTTEVQIGNTVYRIAVTEVLTKDVTVEAGSTVTLEDERGYYVGADTSALDTRVATVAITAGEILATEKALSDPVTGLVSGRQYVILNTRSHKWLSNKQSANNRLSQTGNEAEFEKAALWTVTATTGGYYLQDAAGKYLTFAAGTGTLSDSAVVVTITTSPNTTGAWQIGCGNQYLNDHNQTDAGGWSTNGDAGSQWLFYEILDVVTEGTTQITFTGVKAGETSLRIGDTIYNITVTGEAAPTVDVELLVGETETITGVTGNVDTTGLNTAVATVAVSTSYSASESNAATVTPGASYLIVAYNHANSVLTSASTGEGKLTMETDAARTPNDARVWTLEAVEGGYKIKSAAGYLVIGENGTVGVDAAGDVFTIELVPDTTGNRWRLGSDGLYLNSHTAATCGTYNLAASTNANSHWYLYEVAVSTDVTVAGVAAGETAFRIGDTIYNITVTGDAVPEKTVNVGVGDRVVITDNSGNYTDAVDKSGLDESIATVAVTGAANPDSASAAVSSLISGKQYIIVNSRAAKVLNNTTASTNAAAGTGSGLSLNGTIADVASATVWTIEGSNGTYTVKDADGRYLSITANGASVGTNAASINIARNGSTWVLSQDGAYLNDFGGNGTCAAGWKDSTAAGDPGSQWDIHEYIPASGGTTTITVTGVAEGRTSVKVGDTVYNITVTPDGAHNYVNGFCVDAGCGAYQPAVLNAEGVYEISNGGQLYWFAALVNGDTEAVPGIVQNADANAVLTCDIRVNDAVVNNGAPVGDTSALRQWVPIGRFVKYNDFVSYTGSFDGQGYTISGLYAADAAKERIALFGVVGGNAAIENLGLNDSYFSGKQYVGGIVAEGYSTTGQEPMVISGCRTENTVVHADVYYVGGIAGHIARFAEITDCRNGAAVNGGSMAGGIIGYCGDGTTVTDCFNEGAVSGTAAVGGIAGANNDGNFEKNLSRCANTGDITGTSEVGGVVGQNSSTVEDCYNWGDVTGTGTNVGGVVGSNLNSGASVEDCYNTGSVSTGEGAFGPVIGGSSNTSEGAVENCYYLADSETDEVDGTTAKTAAQFASGEVTYLLNHGLSDDSVVWYQTLETDDAPLFEGEVVCYDAGRTPPYYNGEPQTHEHVYDQKKTTEEYLATPADCENAATYYYSCSCGLKGTETFEDGEALGHAYGAAEYTWSEDGKTCTAKRTCGNDVAHVETATATVTSAESKAPTCEVKGETTYTATFTEDWAETQTLVVEDVAALGHAYGDPVIVWNEDNTASASVTCANDKTHIVELEVKVTSEIKEGDCETASVTTYTATVEYNGKTYTDTKTVSGEVPGHTPAEAVRENEKAATCDKAGSYDEVVYCSVCGEEISRKTVTVDALGHKDADKDHQCDACGKVLSECVDENKDYKCDICGKDLEKPEDPEQPEKDEVIRLAGSHRWETALKVAHEMKANLGIEKLGAIIIASGNDFADALAGSYLSTVKNAPILLGWGKGGKFEYLDTDNIAYIKANLAEGGTVYILGGKNAVPELYENELKGYNVKRLGGANRFETNLLILAEAGVADGSEILVCTSTNFADSLSASATAKPILLVFNEYGKLYGKQPEFLAGLKNCTFTVIGGESAVSAKLADAIKAYGAVTRLAGANRFETSVMVAQKYFKDVDTAVLAYAWNYPDGLCGGSLAYSLKAPLILTMTKYEAKAVEYAKAAGIETGLVLGGDTLISDEAVRAIFAMDAADEIIEK